MQTKRLKNFTITLALAASLTHCATGGSGEGGDAVQAEPKEAQSAPAQDAKAGAGVKITSDAESKNQSLKECGYYAIPDAALGVGSIFIISNPLMPVIALGFVGGHYWTCYLFRQDDLPRTINMEPSVQAAIDQARRETAEQLKDDFNKVRQSLEKKSDAVDQSVSSMREQLKETGEQQKKDIEQAGNHVMKELYDELDAIRHMKIQIHEESEDEYVPSSSKALKEQGQKD